MPEDPEDQIIDMIGSGFEIENGGIEKSFNFGSEIWYLEFWTVVSRTEKIAT